MLYILLGKFTCPCCWVGSIDMGQYHVECLAGGDCVRHDMSIFANPAQVNGQKGRL